MPELTEEELALVRQLLNESDPNSLAIRDRLLYKEHPVDMEEFIRGENYLNRNDIWPRVVALAKYIDQPHIHRALLNLGKGSGKTTIMGLFLARGAYLFGCYRDPRAVFNIGADSTVAMINMSTSRDQAYLAVFGELKSIVKRSKWFKNRADVLTNKIRFEGEYWAICGHSGTIAWEGLNVFYGVVDEVNKMRDKRDRAVGQQIFELLVSQSETRFPDHYKIIAASSSGDGPKFLDREIDEAKKRGLPLTYDDVLHMR